MVAAEPLTETLLPKLNGSEKTTSPCKVESAQPHPFDPLSPSEIETTVALISKQHGKLFYNTVALWEPRKAEMLAFLENPITADRPHRVADVIAYARGELKGVFEGLVDLTEGQIVKWEKLEGMQPLVRSNS
jgi:primary-amine oxidase